MYAFVWRETTRAGWTRSEASSNNHRLEQISSNHHRLVRVLKHPDGSVSRTGRQDKPLPPAACPWAWVRILGESRDAAHVTVAPIDTAHPYSHRSRSSEILFDVRVCMERNDEGKMDPERGQLEQSSAETDQLEPSSAGTGFETPGRQCLPNWETGQTTAAGCLSMGMGSNFGGNTFPLAEIAVATRADSEITPPSTASNTVLLQTSCKHKDKKTASKENKLFDPGEKEREPPPWKAGIMIVFSFLGEIWVWVPAACLVLFLLVCLLCFVSYYQAVIQRAERYGRKEENQ